MSDDTGRQSKAVFDHHMQVYLARDLDGILSDYTEDSVVIVNLAPEPLKGLAAIRGLYTQAMEMLTPEALSRLTIIRQAIYGEIAYVAFSAGEAIPLVTDTFLIRDGKIAVQTATVYVLATRAPAVDEVGPFRADPGIVRPGGRSETMTTEENRAIVRRLYEEFYGKRDTAVLDEIVASDYVRHFAWDGWRDQKARGPEAYRQEMRDVTAALPDFTFTYEQMIAEGDKVVVVSRLSGTQQGDWPGGPYGVITATGRRLDIPLIVVTRISEGKIAEDWESDNWGSFWQQLGAIPTPGKADA